MGNERLFAFLEDTYVTCQAGSSPIFNALRRELWTHLRIQIHLRKTLVFGNKEGSNHQRGRG